MTHLTAMLSSSSQHSASRSVFRPPGPAAAAKALCRSKAKCAISPGETADLPGPASSDQTASESVHRIMARIGWWARVARTPPGPVALLGALPGRLGLRQIVGMVGTLPALPRRCVES
jgi:hypothetical protein